MSFPQVLVFNIAYFRAAYPEFGNSAQFTDVMLDTYWQQATQQISSQNYGVLRNAGRQRALNLLTAHLAKIALLNTQGEVPGIITHAQVDKVQVQLEPPPLPDQWQWWLNTTEYGQSLLALLQVYAAGGFYIPAGQPVLTAFRY
jgi:hypothetical protein